MQTTDPRQSASRRGASRLWRENRGAMAIITALMMIPVLFAMGMAFDLTLAQSRKDKIQGYSDAAALGGVTPAMMSQSDANSVTQSTALFEGQLAMLPGVTYSDSNFTITATDNDSGVQVNRTVVVTWKANSQNVFGTLLGMSTFPISGTSTAASSTAPNINFYLLLDSSPSMEIAATTAGINTMIANEPGANNSGSANYGGCGFGCHESNPSADNLMNPGGASQDNYALARSLNVTLRLDLVNSATQNLMQNAYNTEQADGATYQAAIYTIDYNFNTLQALTGCLYTTQTCANPAYTSAGNLAPLEVYDNNCLTSSNCNSDEDSYLDMGLSSIDNAMPNPGNGTNNAGDTPQEVLMIVSDGVVDELYNGNRTIAPINTLASWCSTIKARGIRIAFLYTTYQPLPTNSFYENNVASFQPNIATDAQNCASPGLFYQVSTDGDINAALQTLFQEAVATARLTH